MKHNFKENITLIYKSYLIKRLEVSNYRMYNAYTNSLITKLDVEKIFLSGVYDKSEFNYDEFKQVSNELKSQNRTYETINYEFIYKLHFQFFEEFLSETLYSCFLYFPKYMNQLDSKHEVSFEKIFDEASSIEDIRDYIITNKVKKVIQSNNILDIISKIEKLFSFKFNFTKDELDSLFLSSLNRNILTHNGGTINEIYISQLKIRQIKSDVKKGDNILLNLKSILRADMKNLDTLVNGIYKVVIKDEKRLEKHCESL